MGVKKFCTKLPKCTPLRQIWSNKSFGVCGSDVVLTLYGGEKKSRPTLESPLENRVVYNTTSLPRRRDIGRSRCFSKGVDQFDRKFQMKGEVPPNHCWCQRNKVFVLRYSEDPLILSSFLWVQYQNATDRRTDRIVV